MSAFPLHRLYLDNAATSFPKPPAVLEAMAHYAADLGASPGRGGYAEAREAGHILQQCRQRLMALIHGPPRRPEHIIFTLNASDALNLAIRGMLRPGDHAITTWMEHNSVLRPLNALAARLGIEQTRVACDPQSGRVNPDDIRRSIRPNTRLIAVVHGSNVSGTLQPIRAIGRMAREHDIAFLVDAAQTLGHVPLDVQADFIDLLAFPGHKGLMGPSGTGGLYIRPGIERRMTTVREGGTGSQSESDYQPDCLPDRFEAGSHNILGIAGLSAGVQWILDRGVTSLWNHERELMHAMIDGLCESGPMPGLTWYGPHGIKDRCGVFSVRVNSFTRPQELSDALEGDYGILTRSGLHCAPLAHRTLGTADSGGTTRLSLGPFLTTDDIRRACDALSQVCRRQTMLGAC